MPNQYVDNQIITLSLYVSIISKTEIQEEYPVHRKSNNIGMTSDVFVSY